MAIDGPDPPGHLWTALVGPFFAGYAVVLLATRSFLPVHALILGSALVLVYVPRLRPWMKPILPFFLFGVAYDAMRFVTPLARELVTVHVAEPYHLELALFGVTLDDGTRVVPTTYFAQHTNVAVDLATAFAYFAYLGETLLVALWLLAYDRPLLRRYAWAFFTLCIASLVTYHLYPAAPPWYVEQYGLGPAVLHAPASAARLADIDVRLGMSLFRDFYAHSTNVFGAIPSLHAADPLLAWLYARRHLAPGPYARWHWVFGAFWVLVCFAAVYLRHHYVIDVLAGWLYALVAYAIIEGIAARRG